MSLRDWDIEFNKFTFKTRQLSDLIINEDRNIKREFNELLKILYQEDIRSASMLSSIISYSHKSNNEEKNQIAYWIKHCAKEISNFHKLKLSLNNLILWKKILKSHLNLRESMDSKKLSFEFHGKLEGLFEEFFFLRKEHSQFEKRVQQLQSKKLFWMLANENNKARSKLNFDVVDKSNKRSIKGAVNKVLSPLYEQSEYLQRRSQLIRKHKYLTQALTKLCRDYMDLAPQINFSSRQALIFDIKKTSKKLDECENQISHFDLSDWSPSAPICHATTKSSLKP